MSSRPRSIIVTGGASGIGLAIARSLASEESFKTHVSILDINAIAGAKVLAQLKSDFPSASFSFFDCDVSSWESQASIFEQIYTEQGRIDIVFANAGVTEKGKIFNKNEDKPSKPNLLTVNVNLFGTLYSVNLATHYIMKNEASTSSNGPPTRGSIICTASNVGIYPFPVGPLYASSKHGVVGLIRSLALPLKQEHIQINALAPSCIATNLSDEAVLFTTLIPTPMSTLIKAVAELVSDSSLTGQVAEISGENLTWPEAPDYSDEATKFNLEMFWKLGVA